ncbi:6-phosphofructokinase, partial [Candidatus Fermentibacterales bacterium]|nr:6-phosphofructokinase [Candidatus Fermentibacterales bacterium]
SEAVLIPETRTDLGEICAAVRERVRAGKTGNILVVAEGDELGRAVEIAAVMKRDHGIESHVTILGHIQRGGSPTAADRVLASKLGCAAVEALLDGAAPCMVGEVGGRVERHPLPESWNRKKPLDSLLVELAERLR